MTPQQKLDLALRIEALGVDVIESGFPASSPSEAEATRLIAQHLTTAHFTTFCRAVRRDVQIAVEAGGTERHEVQVLATASDLHLERKRQISRKQAIDEITDTVRFAKSSGVEAVSVGLEDSTRGDDDLLRGLTEAGIDAGATCVVVCDTSGCMTPDQFADLVAKVRTWAPEPIRVSTHCHNDLGLSLANTLAGLTAGATEVQTTLGGIGERAGNTAMEELVAVLRYRSDNVGVHTTIDPAGMYQAYTRLRGIIGLGKLRNKPIFGEHAFSTAAGIHQQGILRDPSTYEYIDPVTFGRERSMLVARHSGRAVLHHILDQLDMEVAPSLVDDLYRRHIIDRPGGDCEDLASLRQRLVEELSQPV